MKFQAKYRKTDEMSNPSFEGLKDPYGLLALTPEKRRAFANRPYRDLWDVYCQKVFCAEGVAFGCEIQFPLVMKMPHGRETYLAGSTSFVAKEYRKSEVGAHFNEFTEAVSPGYGTCGGGMSQLMVRVLKYFKVPLFFMPRLILLFRTRSVVEMKLKGGLAKSVSMVLDSIAAAWYVMLEFLCRTKVRGYVFEKVMSDNEQALGEVAALIAADTHPYGEVHDLAWLKWMMTESFDPAGPMELIGVRKAGRLVSFYMTKTRFHEQASTRGFKRVWLASIMEWATIPQEAKNLRWFVLHAALSFRKTMDAFELVTVDPKLLASFKKFGARQVGEGNYTVSPPRGSKPAYYAEMVNPDNWRLRPAMGDVGLI